MKESCRVLVVDDSENLSLMQRRFKSDGFEAVCQRAANAAEVRRALKEDSWDIALVDYRLLGNDVPHILENMRAQRPEMPVILLSDDMGGDKLAGLLDLGFWDFVLKSGLTRLTPVVERNLRAAKKEDTRQKVEEKARETSEHLQGMLRHSPLLMSVVDLEGRYLLGNEAIADVIGAAAPEELIGRSFFERMPPESRGSFNERLEEILRTEKPLVVEDRMTVDGEERVYSTVLFPVYDAEGRITALGGVAQDITTQIESQEMLQAQQQALHRAHQLLNSHLQNSALAVVEWDADFRVMRWSGLAEEFFGWSEAEVLGKHPTEWRFVYEGDADTVSQVMDELLNGAVTHNVAMHRNYTKQGGVRYCEWYNSVVRDETGDLVSIFSLVHDVTEQRRAQDSLRESESYLQAILDNIPAVLCRWKPDTTLTYVNDRYVELITKTPDVIGRKWLDFVPCEVRETVVANYKELAANPRTISLEHNVTASDGSRPWFYWVDVPLCDESGATTEFLSIGVDITDRKQAEEALRHRVAIEKYLADMSMRFINLPIGQTDMAIDASLAEVGELMEADRSYVFLFDHVSETVTNTHEWCASGIEEQRDRLQNVPQAVLPNWIARLRRGRAVSVPQVTGLPGDMPEKGLMEDLEIRSVVFVPIVSQDKLWGFLGFDAVRAERDWAGDDIQVLETAANTFALAFERKEAEEERLKLEAEFRQSQKMEAVGRLAGGVAHDFNNMLSVILGHAEFMRDHVQPGDAVHDDLTEIINAAKRSADLTRQLLAFARKQAIAPLILDINETIDGMLKMLQRLLGEDIKLEWRPGGHLWPVMMDPSQIDQILANLAVNARDAIEGGGTITIETANAELDAVFCAAHEGSSPGEYVRLTVSDNGCGMDAQTLSLIFEPFYTTKEAGKGTGLGLATVYGIVKQNKGFVDVESEPGQGAAFHIYLPRHVSARKKNECGGGGEGGEGLPKGGETILLVEDEPTVLAVTSRYLERLGYRVLTADDPKQALEIASAYPDDIDLLLTDMVMPGLNGSELRDQLQAVRPGVKTLFVSGYTAEEIPGGAGIEGSGFLQKPFTIAGLAAKVRETLGGEPPRGGGADRFPAKHRDWKAAAECPIHPRRAGNARRE